MQVDTIQAVRKKLHHLEDEVHFEVYRHTRRAGSLFDRTFGMCDFMTAWTLQQLRDEDCKAIHFVGIDIPKRELHGKQTHSSHTVGLLYDFKGDNEDKVVWFDYACAQYGIDAKALVEVWPRETVYHRLRDVYGGGIWGPGGSWLSQLDVKTFGQYLRGLKRVA